MSRDTNVVAVYMSYDALVQRARNDIFKLAYDHKVDDLVFIDCDQDWNPEDFFRLLSHDVSVVGAPVRKKSDEAETYNVKLLGDYVVQPNGLVEVDGIGTGFLRIRRDAIEKLQRTAPVYRDPHKGTWVTMIFDVQVRNGELWSEDIVFCDRWLTLGGKIYIDPTINCGHTGDKRWVGNFAPWIESVKKRKD